MSDSEQERETGVGATSRLSCPRGFEGQERKLPPETAVSAAPRAVCHRGPVPTWLRDEWRASAELLHARPMPADGRRRVSWLRPAAPAVILGSASPNPFADTHTDVVRRRSGGGLVWLDPSVSTWIDVFVPAADPLWHPDVSRSFHWLGSTLARAFVALGIQATAHTGPYDSGPSDGLVCFATLGPGEVVANGKKLVGISQRRTRQGARFQCVTYQRFDLGPLARLLDPAAATQVLGRATAWQALGINSSPSTIAALLMDAVAATSGVDKVGI